jgi:hypothetical protein
LRRKAVYPNPQRSPKGEAGLGKPGPSVEHYGKCEATAGLSKPGGSKSATANRRSFLVGYGITNVCPGLRSPGFEIVLEFASMIRGQRAELL